MLRNRRESAEVRCSRRLLNTLLRDERLVRRGERGEAFFEAPALFVRHAGVEIGMVGAGQATIRTLDFQGIRAWRDAEDLPGLGALRIACLRCGARPGRVSGGAIAGAATSAEKLRRAKRKIGERAARSADGDVKEDARVGELLEKLQPTEELPAEGRSDHRRRELEIGDQHFTKEAARCDRTKDRSAQGVFVDRAIAAEHVRERGPRAVDFHGHDEPGADVNAVDAPAVFGEGERATGVRAVEAAEEITERRQAKPTREQHPFGDSSAR